MNRKKRKKTKFAGDSFVLLQKKYQKKKKVYIIVKCC